MRIIRALRYIFLNAPDENAEKGGVFFMASCFFTAEGIALFFYQGDYIDWQLLRPGVVIFSLVNMAFGVLDLVISFVRRKYPTFGEIMIDILFMNVGLVLGLLALQLTVNDGFRQILAALIFLFGLIGIWPQQEANKSNT